MLQSLCRLATASSTHHLYLATVAQLAQNCGRGQICWL